MGFNRAYEAAGWNPFTADKRHWINPWVKYNFYEDVFANLDKFSEKCDQPLVDTENVETVVVSASGQPLNDLNRYQYCVEASRSKECSPNVERGLDLYRDQTDAAIKRILTLANTLDKIERDHAAAKLAMAATSAAAAATSIVVSIIGVVCAPVTAGASLALTAVGVGSAVVSVSMSFGNLLNDLVKEGVTDEKLTELKAS